jgi:glycosyltransferase involved in cell wall biosynthesis
VSIKALCVTQDPDRPTVATFIGLHEAGVDVSVVCPPGRASDELSRAGVTLVDGPFFDRIDKRSIREIRHKLIDGEYDILHLFSNRALQNGLLATRGMPIRIVAYRGIVGNVSFWNPVSWMRFLNPRIDRIICVADAVRDYFLKMRPAFLRLPASKLVRIYKGHDPGWYRAEPADLGTIGVPADAFVVTVVANYRPRKGIEVLIDALETLPRTWPVHLLLVGNMDAPALSRKIAKSAIADRIHRTGHRDDAPALTAASDVFVLPSIRREGLARSLIEAMAYARPVIATDCGGSPELVVDGESGIVVAPGDAVALARAVTKLYEDPALRQRLGAAARERIARDFRIEDTIAQTLAVYRSLVADD